MIFLISKINEHLTYICGCATNSNFSAVLEHKENHLVIKYHQYSYDGGYGALFLNYELDDSDMDIIRAAIENSKPECNWAILSLSQGMPNQVPEVSSKTPCMWLCPGCFTQKN